MKENITKKDTTAQALLDVEKLSTEIKEGTKASLKSLLSEAVDEYIKKTVLKEAEEEDQDKFEVEDVEVDTDETEGEKDTDSAEETDDVEKESDKEEGDTTEVDVDADAESTDDVDDSVDGDEWAEFDEFKTDDGYDFTGAEGGEVIQKVFKLLNNDDQVLVKDKGDGMIGIKDNETGAEYLIDTDGVTDDCGGNTCDDDLELELTSESINEEEVDLGYTDNYQDRTAMTTDGVAEPADSESTTSWDEGVPTDDGKRWAGKGNSEPFTDSLTEDADDLVGVSEEVNEEQVDEEQVDEITTVTANNARKMPKTHTSEPRSKHLPYGSKHISAGGEYKENITEAILKKAKAIQEENKQYKKCVEEIKRKLQEAVVVNVSLSKIVKLFTENTTSQKEKHSIVERFDKVTTVKECNALYESIQNELNSGKANVVIEKQISVEPSQALNETCLHEDSSISKMKELMNEMDKIYGKR